MGKMQPAPIVDGAYSDESRPFSIQDTCNWLPVPAEQAGSRSQFILKTPPGLQEFAWTPDTRKQRGGYVAEGRLFYVADTTLFQLLPTGQRVEIGTIPGVSRCSFAHNGVSQLIIVNGSQGYVYDWSAETFTQITDEGFPGGILAAYIGSLFVVVEPQRRYFQNSALNDGENWNALETYQGEAKPDRIVSAIVANGEYVALSERSVEHFAYTGEVNALFQNKGITLERGCAATHAVSLVDNAVCFIGDDGSAYAKRGYQLQRISNAPIEQAWKDCDLAKAYSFIWEDKGHKVWYVTFPDGFTWGYDFWTQKWHRRASEGMNRWRLAWLVKWNGDWYGGEYNGGRIFRLTWGYVLEGSARLRRTRVSGVAHDNQNKLTLNALELVVEASGPATTAEGVLPLRIISVAGDVPDGVTGTIVDYTYQAVGGQGPYTFAIDGTLPTGCAFDSGHVTGTYTTPGTYGPWTIQVTDSAGDTATLNDSATVTAALYLSGDAPDGVIGVSYSYGYTAHEGTAPYTAYAISAGALPSGITLNTSTGVISGTPTTAGSYSWTVRVTDTAGDTATLADSAEVPVVVRSINLNALTNSGSTSANGVTINTRADGSALQSGDTVTITLVAGTYTAWRETATTTWRCRFKSQNAAATIVDHYASASSTVSAAAALALATPDVTLTGSTSYTLWLPDSYVLDNVGGLSMTYTVT